MKNKITKIELETLKHNLYGLSKSGMAVGVFIKFTIDDTLLGSAKEIILSPDYKLKKVESFEDIEAIAYQSLGIEPKPKSRKKSVKKKSPSALIKRKKLLK